MPPTAHGPAGGPCAAEKITGHSPHSAISLVVFVLFVVFVLGIAPTLCTAQSAMPAHRSQHTPTAHRHMAPPGEQRAMPPTATWPRRGPCAAEKSRAIAPTRPCSLVVFCRFRPLCPWHSTHPVHRTERKATFYKKQKSSEKRLTNDLKSDIFGR